MIQRNEQLVIVRGGGDIATGTISRLFRSGYPVVILEISTPSAIRRQESTSFSRSGVQYLKTGTSMGLSRCDFGKEKSGDKPPDGR